MIRWIVGHLIWFIFSLVVLAFVIIGFFALGGFDTIMRVFDDVVKVTGGQRG